MFRLRLGISLIIISWLPIAQLLIYIAHSNQKLTSSQSSDIFRLIIWGLQIAIGLIGVWLAGKIVIAEARKDGWKKTPGNIWQLFLGRKAV